MFSNSLLEKILNAAMRDAMVEMAEEKFLLIVRKGVNNQGKTIQYYLNYSAEEQTTSNRFSDGVELLSGSEIKNQGPIHIAPWDLRIVKEK